MLEIKINESENAAKIIVKKVRETGYINSIDYYYTLAVQFIVALVPQNIRGWIFKKLLHKKI